MENADRQGTYDSIPILRSFQVHKSGWMVRSIVSSTTAAAASFLQATLILVLVSLFFFIS